MAQEDEPVYSHDEVVREVSDLYDLLTGLHIPDSALYYPPIEGWEEIDSERYAWLNKDDTVIDLMRHLPYIYKDDHSEGHEIYTMTAAVDYIGPYVSSCMESGSTFNIEPPEEYTSIPPYVLTLAAETSGGDGSWILVNTRRGTVTLYEPTDGPDKSPLGKGTVRNEVRLQPAEIGMLFKDTKADERHFASRLKMAVTNPGESTVLGELLNSLKF